MRLALAAVLCALTASAAGPLEFFETDVRPILAEHCFACHTQTKMGGLAMTSREALLEGGASGPAVEPKAPERSLLIQAVRYDHERLKMPPAGKLSEEQIGALVRWVDNGAVWPAETAAATAGDDFEVTDEHRRYWAFQPVRKPTPPHGADGETPIDRFLLDRLRKEGIKPAGAADKRTLLRRAYFDLTGLPPTPEQADAFQADDSPEAFAKVVDSLLASPHYGERWGRHWLDVARYSDDRLNSTQDEPFANAFRFRDWVIAAFNADMPYDLFVKAQIAGDLLTDEDLRGRMREDVIGGLSFYGLSPKFQDDRIDVLGRGMLGLTLACAQCHDHKFDPIPTEDYYALLGVFNSTETAEHALAPEPVVAEYTAKRKAADDAKAELDGYLKNQALQLVDIFAAQTERFLLAAWRVSGPEGASAADAAAEAGVDQETLERWVEYLGGPMRDQPLLDEWQALLAAAGPKDEVERFAREAQELIVDTIAEKKRVDKENELRLGGDMSAGKAARTELLSLERDRYFLWRDIASPQGRKLPVKADSGVLYYEGKEITRFLDGLWKRHVETTRERVEALEKQVPEKYPFYHVIKDVDEPRNEHVHIRGSADNLGDEVPRRFLTVLADEPKPFEQGSGRLELARLTASAENPLTARVMANRVWAWHFGRGIVGTPSNFGQMGERPTHPELLDYLAARLVESGWSLKALHREIMLSAAYARAAANDSHADRIDAENRLLWRANRRRLDVESLRDGMLFVSGRLDLEAGGPPHPLNEAENRRRTVYGFVSRRRLDAELGLFDFPNPNNTSPRRIATDTPLQGLYFLNSPFVEQQAEALADRVAAEAGDAPKDRIERLYRLLFGRRPTKREANLTSEFVTAGGSWPRLAQTLLTSNEFLYAP